MWSYYGAKTNIVDHYPPPIEDTIIEPFAGSAKYALKYFEKDVILYDKYDVIVKIWKYLQQCSERDILSLPRFTAGQNINDFKYDCEEQRMLIGFLVGFGFADPRKTATPRLRNRPNAMNYTINQIAKQLYKIKHWKIIEASYDQIPNQKATWFIDPPYQHGGHVYKHSNKKIDFAHLSEWCQSREGHIIVCENTKADWMEFKPFITHQVLSGKNIEAIWSNYPTSADYIQQTFNF